MIRGFINFYLVVALADGIGQSLLTKRCCACHHKGGISIHPVNCLGFCSFTNPSACIQVVPHSEAAGTCAWTWDGLLAEHGFGPDDIDFQAVRDGPVDKHGYVDLRGVLGGPKKDKSSGESKDYEDSDEINANQADDKAENTPDEPSKSDTTNYTPDNIDDVKQADDKAENTPDEPSKSDTTNYTADNVDEVEQAECVVAKGASEVSEAVKLACKKDAIEAIETLRVENSKDAFVDASAAIKEAKKARVEDTTLTEWKNEFKNLAIQALARAEEAGDAFAGAPDGSDTKAKAKAFAVEAFVVATVAINQAQRTLHVPDEDRAMKAARKRLSELEDRLQAQRALVHYSDPKFFATTHDAANKDSEEKHSTEKDHTEDYFDEDYFDDMQKHLDNSRGTPRAEHIQMPSSG